MAPSVLFYSVSSKYSSMAAICTQKPLKAFQREGTRGTGHTETSLRSGLPSPGTNFLPPTVPRPGRAAVRREGEGRQLGLAEPSVSGPPVAPRPQRCRCLGLGAGALFPGRPGRTSPLTRCGSLFLFSAVSQRRAISLLGDRVRAALGTPSAEAEAPTAS